MHLTISISPGRRFDGYPELPSSSQIGLQQNYSYFNPNQQQLPRPNYYSHSYDNTSPKQQSLGTPTPQNFSLFAKENILPSIFRIAGEPYAFVDPKKLTSKEDESKYLKSSDTPINLDDLPF